MMASIPFFAIMGAGILIDQYRGDFSPGLQAPEFQQVGSFANLKVVMALFLFVEMGGLMILITSLYQSYAVFPPGVVTLGVPQQFAQLLAELLQNVFILLIIVALPIMIILFLIEFGVNMVFRLAGQIKMPSVEFLIKTLVFVLAMPVLVLGLARAIEAAFSSVPPPLTSLQEMLEP